MPVTDAFDKKNRLTRACDTCRRRKVKCDLEAFAGVSCQRCVTASIPCTWNDEVKKRGRKRRVDVISARLKSLEKVFAESMTAGQSSNTDTSPSADGDEPSPADTVEDEANDLEIISLMDRIRMLEISSVGVGGKFSLGASSGVHIAQHVLEFSKVGRDIDHPRWRPDPWEEEDALKWRMEVRNYVFPPSDLLPKLIQAYFDNVNRFAPLLHRPTFDELVENKTHIFEPNFAAVLLLVCANGARFVDDPRVYLPNTNRRSAGWGYYTQTEITRPDLLAPPTLFRIQAYVLGGLFLGGIFSVRGLNNLLGTALRAMEELGLSSKKVYNAHPNANDELFKRCFWIALHMEVTMASETGRPCAFSDQEFDVELPLECDDDRWNTEDPAQSFLQPADRPSILAYFNHVSRLKKIHMKALRTLFSIQADSRRRKDALMEIESALNEWLEETPVHLKWGIAQQNRSHDIFFDQAARLRLDYNVFLLIIHRPGVRLNKQTPESETSLAICYHAARGISNICDLVGNDLSITTVLLSLIAAYSASILLLLKLLDARKSGNEAEIRSILGEVEKCLNALRAAAPLFRHADAFSRRLLELASRGNVRFPSSSASRNDNGVPVQAPSSTTHPSQSSLASQPTSDSVLCNSTAAPAVSFFPQPSSSKMVTSESVEMATQAIAQLSDSAIQSGATSSGFSWQGMAALDFGVGTGDSNGGSLPAHDSEADAEWANTLLMELSRTTSQENGALPWNFFPESQV